MQSQTLLLLKLSPLSLSILYVCILKCMDSVNKEKTLTFYVDDNGNDNNINIHHGMHYIDFKTTRTYAKDWCIVYSVFVTRSWRCGGGGGREVHKPTQILIFISVRCVIHVCVCYTCVPTGCMHRGQPSKGEMVQKNVCPFPVQLKTHKYLCMSGLDKLFLSFLKTYKLFFFAFELYSC